MLAESTAIAVKVGAGTTLNGGNVTFNGAVDSLGPVGPGSLTVNTSGGGLSYCHPGMFGIFLLIEAVRQLRGEAGDRQVVDAEVALVHGTGGILTSHATAILGRDR